MLARLGDFEAACHAVLAFLHQRLGMGLWLVTRTVGEDMVVLQAVSEGYGVARGSIFRWEDTCCAAMVRGEGPSMAPDTGKIPAYASAALAGQLGIHAYVGFPLANADGSLFGTLCGMDRSVQPEALADELPLVELLTALLRHVLNAEQQAAMVSRRLERLEIEAGGDALTRLANRRGWDRAVAREEERCRRYGVPAAVVMIDLDELKQLNDRQGHAAGDTLIQHAADALRTVVREPDLVARLGGDEFGVLALDCDRAGVELLVERIRMAFGQHGVKASIGCAQCDPTGSLSRAIAEADGRMYEDKRSRH